MVPERRCLVSSHPHTVPRASFVPLPLEMGSEFTCPRPHSEEAAGIPRALAANPGSCDIALLLRTNRVMTTYKFTLGMKTCAPEGETACLGLWARQTAGREPPRPARPEPATGGRQSPATAARRPRYRGSREPADWRLWRMGCGDTPLGGHWGLRRGPRS